MKLFTRFVFALTLLLNGAIVAQELSDEDAARVIARVGDEEITAGQFARDLQFRLAQLRAATGKEITPDLRIRRLLMDELIQERILSIAARNADIEVPEAELEEEFQARRVVFDSDAAYEDYLKRLKLTEEELKERMRSRIRIKHFVDGKTGDITVTPEDVDARYEVMKSEGKMNRNQDTRDIAVILLRAKGGSDDDWRAAEDRAKATKARIDGGESFDAVAKEVSEDPNTKPTGGKLYEMQVGSFYPELEAAMDVLEVGDVSDPVRSTMGWYVITLLDVNTPGTVSKDKVADRIEAQLVAEKRKEAVDAIVSESQKLIRVEMISGEESPAAEVTTEKE